MWAGMLPLFLIHLHADIHFTPFFSFVMRVSVLLLCAVYRVAALPKPTADQLTWLQDEVTAMGSYGMPTYASCGIGAVTFAGRAGNLQKVYNTLPAGKLYNPLDLDTDQWARSLKAAGVKHAVLTVQQACGYTLYPSRTAFPEFNFTYDYGIRQSPYKNGTGMRQCCAFQNGRSVQG